jgi:hypothetical protein
MTSDDHPHQVHELLHALGFSTDSWALFRNQDGTPRTPRGADGLPALTPTLCTDGVNRTVMAPSASTLLVRQERGVIVNRMVTPKVVAVARDLLGCSTLEGPELENQPTTSGSCFGSHWEQRLFPQEMMASTASHNSFISALTLAALEDSGWCAPPPHAEGVSLPLITSHYLSLPLITSQDLITAPALRRGLITSHYLSLPLSPMIFSLPLSPMTLLIASLPDDSARCL